MVKKIAFLTTVLAASLAKPPPSQSVQDTTPPPDAIFTDDYFQQEATERDVKSDEEQNLDNCEKVYKNSMVCLICKDPETTAKSEQCSYVSHPSEKFNSKKKPALVKKKESFQAKPRIARDQSGESGEETSYPSESTYSDSGYNGGGDEVLHNYDSFSDSYDTPSSYDASSGNYDSFSNFYNPSASAEYTSESERISQKATKDHCNEIQKDDMICTICKDPKTGDDYEKCSYAFVPSDKNYKYSKSNSFGYPDNNKYRKRKTKKVPSIYERSDNAQEIVEIEEMKTAEDNNDGCHEEIRDSTTCRVCKDPQTGADSENCSYSYKPDEKVYAYTASKSFGSP